MDITRAEAFLLRGEESADQAENANITATRTARIGYSLDISLARPPVPVALGREFARAVAHASAKRLSEVTSRRAGKSPRAFADVTGCRSTLVHLYQDSCPAIRSFMIRRRARFRTCERGSWQMRARAIPVARACATPGLCELTRATRKVLSRDGSPRASSRRGSL